MSYCSIIDKVKLRVQYQLNQFFTFIFKVNSNVTPSPSVKRANTANSILQFLYIIIGIGTVSLKDTFPLYNAKEFISSGVRQFFVFIMYLKLFPAFDHSCWQAL